MGLRESRGSGALPSARATISSGHQITIPIGPFTAAGLTPGDRFEVVAEGPGAVRIERVHRGDAAAGDQPELPAA